MDPEEILKHLPQEQSYTLFREALAGWWAHYDKEENQRLSAEDHKFRGDRDTFVVQQQDLGDRCHQLSAQTKQWREVLNDSSEDIGNKIAVADSELAKVTRERKALDNQLASLESDYQLRHQQSASNRAHIESYMANFLRSKQSPETRNLELRPGFDPKNKLPPIVDPNSTHREAESLPRLVNFGAQGAPGFTSINTDNRKPRQPLPNTPREKASPTQRVEDACDDALQDLTSTGPWEGEQPTPPESETGPGTRSASTSVERKASLDQTISSAASPQTSPRATATSEALGEDINSANLVLKHDGEKYTYPECMVGVPLVRITPSHPYWEGTWPDPVPVARSQLDVWRSKLERIHAEGRPGSAKYQVGRQVNRGEAILKFLDDGDVCPYQLLSKRYIHAGKGSVVAYDTLFRLAHTLEDLHKFKLSVTPVEWLRHRLWEIIQEEGYSFNLGRTMHDFYHDPKLKALRKKNGFKSIGRPSGTGLKERGTLVFREPVVTGGPSPKRKREDRSRSHDSPTKTETTGREYASTPRFPDDILASDPASPERDPAKRSRHSTPATGDSFPIAKIMTRAHDTTSTTWILDAPGHMLRCVSRPEVFTLDLRDIEVCEFSDQTLAVYIEKHSKQASEGVLMVKFDTHETVAQFVKVCQSRGVHTLATSRCVCSCSVVSPC